MKPLRIVIDPDAFRALAAGQVVAYQMLVEVVLAQQVIDALQPPDPPQAREFLPRKLRNSRK